MTERDQQYMELALQQAHLAHLEGEVPIGAVVVHPQRGVVGVGRNRREFGRSALAHAEIEAIDMACRTLKGWRLMDCDLYVTLEPCPMCAGAILNARIRKVYYGAKDHRFGAAGSTTDLFSVEYNHRAQVEGGVLEEECSALISQFFRELRWRRENGIQVRRMCRKEGSLAGRMLEELGCAEGRKSLFAPGTQYFMVAIREGQVIGLATITPDGKLAHLGVLPQWRGHGLAGALHRALEGKARRTGIPRLWCEQRDWQPFLEKMGYRQEGQSWVLPLTQEV
ncbi:MAG: GNAT family N-acetyltransferase [Eubacteriales bacterium]|jgi:tRNA(adenine34) deaminase